MALLSEGVLRFKMAGLGLTIKTAENTKITAKNSLKQLNPTVHGLIFGRACSRKHTELRL